MAERPRIGVYVCHCGANIAAGLDVGELTRFAATLPDVVHASDCLYLCSGSGQTLIQQGIREHSLNRLVIAACSPLLHEATFQRMAEGAGLNAFCVQIVNIREHGSWVHEDREAATRKAMDLVAGAVRRVALHAPLQRRRLPVNPDVLVLGGGIAGIHAALTIASAGRRVYLVERQPSIGGNMARYDKTFPTLECAACILAPKMTAVVNHPNITLWTYSELVKVEGYVGQYRATVRRKARYVREDLCSGCQQCVEACVGEQNVPDAFNLGMSLRKPVYIPFAQAAPRVAVIDPETCIELTKGDCQKTCQAACGERGAIDFGQWDEMETVEVGSIVVATGFQPFDAARAPEYGYGIYPNVYTSMEVERLVNALGPTGGEVVLRDGRRPEAIGIIYCVGSRDERYNRWCSRVCCTTALKLSHLLRQHTGAEIFNFYVDIRCSGKGHEEFYQKALNEGVHFVRGKVAEVCDWALDPSEEGKLVIRAEDTLTGFVRRIPVDMVVLAVGVEPQPDAQAVRRLLNIACATEGFFQEKHPKLAPAPTFTDGVYLAGCCHAPKDIPDTVMQAGYAAAEILALGSVGYVEVDPSAALVQTEACSGCRSCVPLCPYTAIAWRADTRKAEINPALCKGCGICVAACPSGAIQQGLYEDSQIMAEIEGLLSPQRA